MEEVRAERPRGQEARPCTGRLREHDARADESDGRACQRDPLTSHDDSSCFTQASHLQRNLPSATSDEQVPVLHSPPRARAFAKAACHRRESDVGVSQIGCRLDLCQESLGPDDRERHRPDLEAAVRSGENVPAPDRGALVGRCCRRSSVRGRKARPGERREERRLTPFSHLLTDLWRDGSFAGITRPIQPVMRPPKVRVDCLPDSK